jgi:tetratricopeptide (TPR) repeat protein
MTTRKSKAAAQEKWETSLFSYFLIVVAAFAVYHSTLSYGLVAFDDDLIVAGNRPFLQSLSNLPAAFTTDAFFSPREPTFYRPLQTVSFMLDMALRRDSVSIFHFSSLILHCLTCIALFHLLCRMRFEPLLSLIGTLIYTVHPLFGMAVSWIPGRGDLLLGFFATTGFILLIGFVESDRLEYFAGHCLLILCALFAKETAVMLPFVALGWFLLNASESVPPRRMSRVSVMVAGWCGILAVWLTLRSLAIRPDAGRIRQALTSLWTNLPVIPEFVAQFVLPIRIALIPRFTLFRVVLGLLLIAGVTLILLARRQRLPRPAGLGLLWFIAGVLPSMTYTHPLGASAYSYLNQRAYLPMMGVLMIALSLVPAKWHRDHIPVTAGCGMLLVIFLGLSSARESRSFADPVTFYSAAIEENPNSALAYNNRGRILGGSGNFRQALADFNQALALFPVYPDALSNRAFARGAQKDYTGAMTDLAEAIRLNPASAAAYGNLGIVRANLNDYPGALAAFSKAIELDSGYIDAYGNRALLNLKNFNYRGAVADYDEALVRAPNNREAYFGRASAYFQLNDVKAACSDWRQAAALGHPAAAENYQAACRGSQ